MLFSENSFENSSNSSKSQDNHTHTTSENLPELSTENRKITSARISKKINKVLKLFTRILKPRKSNSSGSQISSPSHKNLRVSLIRGHKRMIRNFICNKEPKKIMDVCNSQHQTEAKQIFETQISQHYSMFRKLSKPKNGPKSEGKNQRSQFDSLSNLHKSHNKQYRDDYFSNQDVISSFDLYLDFLFASEDAAEMCKKFDFYCCDINQEVHSVRCLENWRKLRDVLKEVKV